jgi:hypothetical protein
MKLSQHFSWHPQFERSVLVIRVFSAFAGPEQFMAAFDLFSALRSLCPALCPSFMLP